MGKIYNRETQTIYEDVQFAGGGLDFLYNTLIGRCVLKIAICPAISRLYGRYMKTSFSRRHIKGFIEKNRIEMGRFEEREYESFNEFFIRRPKKLDFDMAKNRFVSPADSKLLVYPITDKLTVPVKKGIYTLEELIGRNIDDDMMDYYRGGNCMVFRLAVDDYHRYHFSDDGVLKESEFIKGCLHTISSYADDYKVFCRNSRVVNYLSTEHAGELIVIEVGAMFVGKIVNNDCREFKKGQEKGWFEPGGSTIVVLSGSNLKLDEDILKNSAEGIETKLCCGEGIGTLSLT